MPEPASCGTCAACLNGVPSECASLPVAAADPADNTTPRPWTLGQCSEDGVNWTPQVWPTGYGAPILRMSGRPGLPGRDEADAALILAAVNERDALLARIEWLEGEERGWREGLLAQTKRLGESEDARAQAERRLAAILQDARWAQECLTGDGFVGGRSTSGGDRALTYIEAIIARADAASSEAT